MLYKLDVMRTAKTISITLPPDLILKAQELAEREHRTMSEQFREALRCYMQTMRNGRPCCCAHGLPARHSEFGIKSEEDVERLSDEYRHAKR